MRLQDTNIVADPEGKAALAFDKAIGDFEAIEYSKPSDYVVQCWKKYKSLNTSNNSTNGKVFEYILATLCIREQLLPLFLEAKVAFVPNVNYDLMLYTKEVGPVCFSLKTSLRERYKQADLEAIALKYVHRRAHCYLFTLSGNEADSVKAKVKNGDVIGLNAVVCVDSEDIDNLFSELKKFHFTEAESVEMIQCNRMIR